MTKPLCPCHNRPMRWRNDRNKWRCSVACVEAQQRYRNTPKGRAATRRANNSVLAMQAEARYRLKRLRAERELLLSKLAEVRAMKEAVLRDLQRRKEPTKA